MHASPLHFGRCALLVGVLAAFVALIGAPRAAAQVPAASANTAEAPSPEELETPVGPFALYPDDLVAIILPASTSPLQVVQADRFLARRKQDPNLLVDDNWDEPVKALVNYPEVVKQMSDDLDWTAALGEATVADQGAVLDAVQAFRRKAQSAGQLKTDDKQVVEVATEVITIVPANPQVIYVPQYNPRTVIVYSTAPAWGYYPTPYPVYYYPYPPGAAFATGLIWGAAIGATWRGGYWGTNWRGGTINNNITINRPGGGNVNRPAQLPSGGSAWRPDRQSGQVSRPAGRPSTGSRIGDARPAGGGAAARPSQQPGGGLGARPSQQPGGGLSARPSQQPGGGAGARPSQQPSSGLGGRPAQQPGGGAGARPSQQGGGGIGAGGSLSNRQGLTAAGGASARNGPGGGNNAFGGYGSGRQTNMNSSRGAASRSSMQGGGAGARGGASGARAGGGGGGRR